jgi:hypothetical protein
VAVADGNSITEGTPASAPRQAAYSATIPISTATRLVVIGIAAGANQPAGSAIPVPAGGSDGRPAPMAR